MLPYEFYTRGTERQRSHVVALHTQLVEELGLELFSPNLGIKLYLGYVRLYEYQRGCEI